MHQNIVQDTGGLNKPEEVFSTCQIKTCRIATLEEGKKVLFQYSANPHILHLYLPRVICGWSLRYTFPMWYRLILTTPLTATYLAKGTVRSYRSDNISPPRNTLNKSSVLKLRQMTSPRVYKNFPHLNTLR
jgi:hypothetical protein